MNNQLKNILIVDDEKGLREGTARLLSAEGYSVSQAQNGTEGIKLGTANEFDLALIDLKMPDIDGLEVLSKIKKEKPATVCFINTAFASIDTAIEATRAGAFGYLSKPFTPEELLYNIEKGLRQRNILLESERLKKEREESLLELSYEKSRLSTIIKAIKDGILVVNKENKVVYFNNSVIKYLNIKELKLGDDSFDFLPPKLVNMIKTYYVSESFRDKTHSVQIEIKPDHELIIEAIVNAVRDDENKFMGIVLVMRDITEMKKIETIKSQFVSMVAHELKTPIAAVQGFLNLLSDPTINVSKENSIDYINRSQTRLKSLLDLVNDLLDISRMEINTKQRELESFNIVDSIESTLEFLEFEIKKKEIKVIYEAAENLPSIYADKNEIQRLCTNLISNAIKYNLQGGKILITLSLDGNYVQMSIADTGIGIKDDDKNKLFQEFFRVRSKETRGISGTGLGLAIVKRIIDCYHGKISVKSEYSKGSEFIVKLPINNKKQSN